MRIGIFTPHIFNRHSERRLEMLRDYYIKSLSGQAHKGFDVVLITRQPMPRNMISSVGSAESDERLLAMDWRGLNVRLCRSDMVPWGEYEIQARLDSDDYVFPNYTAKIASLAESIDRPRFLATFIPYIYDAPQRRLLGGIQEWGEKKPSQFSVLYQRDKVTRYVRSGMHCALWKHVPHVEFVPEGYCVWNRHGEQITKGNEFPETRHCIEGVEL